MTLEPQGRTSITDPLNDDPDQRILRLFNHYRHDWMNDIQILMGYVQLKKYDKLSPLMEKIKAKVQQESYISKLGIPHLILHLLTFQAEVKELALDIRLEEEVHLSELEHPEASAEEIIAVLDAFKEEATASMEDESFLVLRLSREGQRLLLTAVYEGAYINERIAQKEAQLNAKRLAEGSSKLEAQNGERKIVWKLYWTYADVIHKEGDCDVC
ncbi:Spo0B domain-containing protein [Paenibacillus naphthalenovorans]|uniref:Spo0B domain-containing protein n=1 Tax=Paenibacillus naphthalenovorans TaxID=162209 RepID=UPI003D29F2F7